MTTSTFLSIVSYVSFIFHLLPQLIASRTFSQITSTHGDQVWFKSLLISVIRQTDWSIFIISRQWRAKMFKRNIIEHFSDHFHAHNHPTIISINHYSKWVRELIVSHKLLKLSQLIWSLLWLPPLHRRNIGAGPKSTNKNIGQQE